MPTLPMTIKEKHGQFACPGAQVDSCNKQKLDAGLILCLLISHQKDEPTCFWPVAEKAEELDSDDKSGREGGHDFYRYVVDVT